MIKNIQLLSILLFTYSFAVAQDTSKVDSKVKKVVVFLKGAQINRIGNCNLRKGKNIINFTKLSSRVDKKSIQVKSDSSIAIQSVNYSINYMDSLSKLQKISHLKKEYDSLEHKNMVQENTLYVLKQEQELLKENQVLSGGKRIIKTKELKEASTYYRNRLSEIILLRNKTKSSIRQIENRKQKVKNQLNELNSKKEKPVGEIWVLVYADEPSEKEFTIEYFISDAGWKPKYDIRAESVSKPAVLTYKADVFQNTDDDWTNVDLILSSSNPSLGGTKPVLKSWKLDLNKNYEYITNNYQDNSNYTNSVTYYENIANDYSEPIRIDSEMHISGTVVDQSGMSIPGATIMVMGNTALGTITDFEGNYSIIVPGGSEKLLVSFIGMKNVELPITGAVVNCTLSEEELNISEIVVVATGVSRKQKALGYSVTTLVPDGFGGFVPEGTTQAGAYTGKLNFKMPRMPRIFKRKKKLINKTLVGLNTVKENQTSVQFLLDKPYTIPSDNKNYGVDIEKYEIPVHYQYSSAPKLDESAFLLAQLTAWESLNLLSGPVNIYFEGSFVGNSKLDMENISDTLDISLGRDRAIHIERKMKEDFSKKQVLSKWKVETYSWEIIVKNNKSEKANILIEDQIPVSYSEGIEIKLLESSDAKYDKTKGNLQWDIELLPFKKKVLRFSYQIKMKNT